MKKIFVFIGILLLSFFPAYTAGSGLSETDPLNLREAQYYSDPLNFEYAPCNIAMNSIGDIAVFYTAATYKGIFLFHQNEKNVSEFHFDHSGGSHFVELSDEEILIYSVRSGRQYHYSMSGEFRFFEDVSKIITEKYTEAISVTQITNASSRLVLKKNPIEWKLFLNDSLIMECDPFTWFVQKNFFLIMFCILLIVFVCNFFRMEKNRMEKNRRSDREE